VPSVVDPVFAERERIQAEYRRRELEIDPDTYATWQPAEMFIREERRRRAIMLLNESDLFPKAGDRCLEIGFGSLGWLGDLISWGLREQDLHGIELNEGRAQKAREALPNADLRIGDATELPWSDNQFDLVIASTVFSSILDEHVQKTIADEIVRVLKPGAAFIWYDLAVNNPRNPNVRGINRNQIRMLLPGLEGKLKSVTLAPPLARFVTPYSWLLAGMLASIPWLRTHLLGVLIKN